ncbi:MAG: 30S ribosome-binding factor RbfA [Spirochaetia bacterium]|nr:30S ribosome-binding factor RbfA [Spirochaetia bacterium]
MDEIRQKRLEKRILQLITEVYFRKLKDPRISFVTFIRCQLSNDIGKADIYFSVYGSEKEQIDTKKALNNSAGFVRGKIAKSLKLKNVPKIFFIEEKYVEQ